MHCSQAKLQAIQEGFAQIQQGDYGGHIGQLFLRFKDAQADSHSHKVSIGMDDTDMLLVRSASACSSASSLCIQLCIAALS
jgi:hypothetical protein